MNRESAEATGTSEGAPSNRDPCIPAKWAIRMVVAVAMPTISGEVRALVKSIKCGRLSHVAGGPIIEWH